VTEAMGREEEMSALHVRIPEELHRRVRVYCAERKLWIKDFVLEALEQRLEKETRPGSPSGGKG
jgi:predicted HicB family RNase H-like nuclease